MFRNFLKRVPSNYKNTTLRFRSVRSQAKLRETYYEKFIKEKERVIQEKERVVQATERIVKVAEGLAEAQKKLIQEQEESHRLNIAMRDKQQEEANALWMKSLGYLHARGIIEFTEFRFKLMMTLAGTNTADGVTRESLWSLIQASDLPAAQGLRQCFQDNFNSNPFEVMKLFSDLSDRVHEPQLDPSGRIIIDAAGLSSSQSAFLECLCKTEHLPHAMTVEHTSPFFKDKTVVKSQKRLPKKKDIVELK